jgi:hypothetical protein
MKPPLRIPHEQYVFWMSLFGKNGGFVAEWRVKVTGVRRMIRILARIGANLSLLVCLAMIVMWVRSYWKSESWRRTSYSARSAIFRSCVVGSGRGQASVLMGWLDFSQDNVRHQPERTGPRGTVSVGAATFYYNDSWIEQRMALQPPASEHWWEKLGIYNRITHKAKLQSVPGIASTVVLSSPYWLLVLLTAIGPALWAWAWWKSPNWPPGCCRKCGYDLRASPEKCPECGAVGSSAEKSSIRTC